MTIQLTSGVLARMCHPTVLHDDSVWNTAPVLQVVLIKEFSPSNQPGEIRRRGLLSDGTVYAPAMFGPQLTTRCEEGVLARNTVICATSISCGVLQEKRFLVLRECRVVETLEHKIGDPQLLGSEGAAAAAANDATASLSSAPPASPTRLQQTTIHPNPQASPHPIGNLSPYLKEWTIEARVTDKSEMRVWSNEKGAGQLFSCTFADQSGDIRATAFNAAAGALFERLHVGRVYFISKARVSITEKASFDGNRKYELTMDGNTRIEEVGHGREAVLRS